MTLIRERYGKYGIASRAAICTEGYWAWGRVGDTTAEHAAEEKADEVWFHLGKTREEAVALLKHELDCLNGAFLV